MKKPLLTTSIIVTALILNSCATVFNKRYGPLTIHSKQKVNYVVDKDTLLNRTGEPLTIYQERSIKPFQLRVFSDTLEEKFLIYPVKSPWYWANSGLLGFYFVGGLAGAGIDELTGRKWTFPRNIYIDLENQGPTYLPYLPMPPDRLDFKNKLSFTPLALVEHYHPGIEMTYQRNINKKTSSQLSFSYLLPRDNEFSKEAEGFEVSFEQKFYIQNTLKNRFYYSFVLEYLNKDTRPNLDLLVPEEGLEEWEWTRTEEELPVQKRFISLIPRIGFEHFITNHIVIDTYFGVGLRYRDVNVRGLGERVIDSSEDWFWVTNNYSNRPNNNLALNFDLNFRLGFLF